MPNNEIQTLIASFAAQLEAVAKRAALEHVLATLGGGMPAAKRGRGPGRPKGSRNTPAPAVRAIKPVRKGKRRSAEDVETMGATLMEHVKANPGQRADEIAKALRSDVGTMRLPMQALLAANKIKTQGQRRGTKYFVAGAAMPVSPRKAGRRSKKK